jgi:hypothetical protein
MTTGTAGAWIQALDGEPVFVIPYADDGLPSRDRR